MDLIQAALLGVLQGLTEFLPVSSSGHLVLAQSLIPNFSQPGVLFDASLHAGTMLSVVVFFWKEIKNLTRRYLWLLLIGTIPAGFAGVLFQEQFEALFLNPKAVGLALLLTGTANFWVDRFPKGEMSLNWKNSFVVGLAQAVAIIPGISRSGATIFAAVAQGLTRKEAATFSFLLSVPAVAGAVFWQLVTRASWLEEEFVLSYIIGSLVAAIVGYLSISLLLRLLFEKRLRIFAFYCWIIGLVSLFFLT